MPHLSLPPHDQIASRFGLDIVFSVPALCVFPPHVVLCFGTSCVCAVHGPSFLSVSVGHMAVFCMYVCLWAALFLSFLSVCASCYMGCDVPSHLGFVFPDYFSIIRFNFMNLFNSELFFGVKFFLRKCVCPSCLFITKHYRLDLGLNFFHLP